RHVPWQLAPRLGGPRETLAGGHALPSGMPDRLTCCSSSDSMSPPNGKAPDHDGRGLDCPVLVVRPQRPHRIYSTSGNRWLGGRDDHLPAGTTALAALDRRGDIVHRDFPISAARAAGRGVVLHVRHV